MIIPKCRYCHLVFSIPGRIVAALSDYVLSKRRIVKKYDLLIPQLDRCFLHHLPEAACSENQ